MGQKVKHELESEVHIFVGTEWTEELLIVLFGLGPRAAGLRLLWHCHCLYLCVLLPSLLLHMMHMLLLS